MARAMVPSQQKLAEKLTILHDRGVGMLIRIYNIKKMLATADSKPAYLNDKTLEPVIKSLVKKFPTIETKSTASVNVVKPIAGDIHKMLSLYYFTFVDIMDFKDNVTNLLTTIDACQVHFDLSLNFDLTKGYLDLISVYLAIMILLSRVDDRMAVLGLFVLAGDIVYNKIEESFPRLGQMIVDYEKPIKRLNEEFIPHSKLVTEAVLSISQIYMKHCTTAEQWRANQSLSLLSDSTKILTVASSDTMQCDYLSMDVLEKWIYFGTLLCHQQILAVPEGQAMWKQVLLGGYVHSLCRDEVIHVHVFASEFFDTVKGYGKKVTEIKQWQQEAVEKAPALHRERRKYLRTALKELALVFADQPGLLGPKALVLFMGLSLARDEFLWLLRHNDNPPLKGKNSKQLEEFYTDRQIPELMFHIEELRALVKRYSQVLQRYYIQFLSGQDTSVISQQIQSLSTCPEDESILLSSFCNAIAGLSAKQVESGESFDFRGLRLDWFRLQTYTSQARSGLELHKYPALARCMNTAIFHMKMVDSLDQVLAETSDLSLYCFHTSLLEKQFKQCLEFPAQHRYIIAFPMICAHFMTAAHELCPEERHSIGTTSIQYGHWFLKEISEEVNQVITTIFEEHCQLADKLLPKNCASQIVQALQQRRKDKKGHAIEEPEKPGTESYRKHREELTRLDKLHMALTELCYAINYCSVITIWEHGFVPREFFTSTLESRLNKALVGMAMYSPERGEIAKPSELYNSVRTVMSVLQGLESYVSVDMSRVFNNVLPQQTQPTDSFSGDKTLTTIYTSWYLEVMLRRASEGHIIYSSSQKAFINITTDAQVQFNAEEYADLSEMRALAELIGPYGMKYMGERVMWHVASQVDELRKLIWQFRDVLREMRTNFDKPEVMKDLQKKLLCADSVLQRMTIIGVLLSFRSLAQEALCDVLENHIPFLMSSIKDFQHHLPNGQDSMVVNEMATAAGLPSDIDPALCAAFRAMKLDGSEEAYDFTCLLMVCVAVSLPRLARLEGSVYKASLHAHLNNIHCLGKAINALAGSLFMIHGRNDIEDRLREFLALASSSLLKLGQEVDKEVIKNRESVFILLDVIVQESPFLTMDLLESCFPYALLRTAYHTVYKYGSENV